MSQEDRMVDLQKIVLYLIDDAKNVSDDPAAQLAYQRCIVRLMQYPQKEEKVPEWERDYIRSLAKAYSVGDLAYIFGRSKSTIHTVVSTVSH